MLSNHGGRQLEVTTPLTFILNPSDLLLCTKFARSGIEVLVEVTSALRERGMFPDPKFEIYVDGGVRRASDVLKAIALGATAGTFSVCVNGYEILM